MPFDQSEGTGGRGHGGGLDQQHFQPVQAPLQQGADAPQADSQRGHPDRGLRQGHAIGVPQEQHDAAEQEQELGSAEPCRCRRDGGVVTPDFGDVERRLRKARCHVGGTPSGALEPDPQFVRPVARMPAVLQQGPVHLEVGPQRVPAVQRTARAVDAGFGFFLETAEDPVPHDQDAAVVAVQIAVVHGMVHAMIGRRAEPAVEPTEAGHVLGVDPELVEQVDQRDHAEHQGRHAGQGHRHIEDPSEQRARTRLPQRRRQVVVLALVMHDMRGPEDGALVAGPVQPVVAEIVEHQRQQPAVPGGPERVVAPQRHAAEDGRVDAHAQQPGEHGAELAEHAQADAVDRIVQPVGIASARPAPGDFGGDQQQEDRRRQDDDLGRAQAHAPRFWRVAARGPLASTLIRRARGFRPDRRRVLAAPGAGCRTSPPA